LAVDRLVVVGRLVNIRSQPSRQGSIIGQVRNGQYVNYEGTQGLWTKIGEYAYIPTIYALPKERVEYKDGIAVAKPLSALTNPLVTPIAQKTVDLNKNTSKVSQLEVPVTVASNIKAVSQDTALVNANTTASLASTSQPNKVSTTTAVQQLAEKNTQALTELAKKLSAVPQIKKTSISTNTAAGSTLMGILKSKPADLSSLKTYTSKHIKSKTVVDSLNNVEAIYDAESKEDTEYTCDEFVKRYYQNTAKIDVVLNANGTPASGFLLTLSPQPGDIAVSRKHRAIVKQSAGEVVTLIEQNYKWADKKKTGFYAPKNRRLTIRQGIGIDSIGTKYTFYTKKTD